MKYDRFTEKDIDICTWDSPKPKVKIKPMPFLTIYGNVYSPQEQANIRLKYLEDLIEQGKLIELPCKVGDTVYAIAKCSDVTRKLDGTYYSSDGSPGTATGWYCAFDGKEDNCPLCGEDNCNEKDYAIFETEVLGMSYSESDEDKGWHIYLENFDSYESYHLTKAEAEAMLKELQNGTTKETI
jgi:hypothetical protein